MAVRRTKLISCWRQIKERWDKMQVGRQGSYSVERLESLNLYCKITSTTRAICVCLATPLPALAVAVFLESLPLRPPSEGWAANWVFWLRLFLLEWVISFSGNTLLAKCVPGLNYPPSKRLMVAFGVSCGYVGTCVFLAATIAFPLPFLTQISTVPIGILTPVMIRIVQGPALFDKNSPFKPLGDRFNLNFFSHMALVMIYPIYKVLYESVPLSYRGIVVIILPVWMLAAKSFVVQMSRELEDYIPEFAAFSVDFFGTLFVSVCMYSSRSFFLSGLFIAVDVGLSLVEFREIRTNAKIVVEILQHRYSSQARLTIKHTESVRLNELLEMILVVVRNQKGHLAESLPEVRLWSCLPCPITSEQLDMLLALKSSGVYGDGSTPQAINQRYTRVFPCVAVAPDTESNTTTHQTALSPCEGPDLNLAGRHRNLAIQGLQLLFHCEYFTLVQYVECTVPLVFITYQTVLKQLPNAIYYPSDDTNWDVASVLNLVVLALLKVVSFLVMSSFQQKMFSFSPLHQLAFVLETQFAAVQVHLLVAINLLLQYQLIHFGADFTLQFKWLHHQN